jgi:hypothetical protein
MRKKSEYTMDLPELAPILHSSRGSIYSLARQNKLPVPVIFIGRRMVVSRAAVERLLTDHKTTNATF